MICSSCTQGFPLAQANGSPPFAFSRAAIVLHDVDQADLGEFWHAQVTQRLVRYRVIFRRVG